MISFLVAAVLGFASHRAGLCTVRAVGEVLHSRRAHILASFAKASLWAVAVSVPLRWLADDNMLPAYSLQAGTLLGGLVFGVGAAVNGGCTFSTLAHLAEGDFSYAGTIAGFFGGAALVDSPTPALTTTPLFQWPALTLLALAWVWGLWQITRLWNSRSRTGPLVTAERYRLSTSAVILGVGGGSVFQGQKAMGSLFGLNLTLVPFG